MWTRCRGLLQLLRLLRVSLMGSRREPDAPHVTVDHSGPRVVPQPRRPVTGPPRPGGPARWRAGTLASVYILMAIHIVHWKVAGKTLAPLELNEVMHTLELGVVTAGFIFMSVALLSVVIFGRFFCSWGCHILALEDLCAWIMAKLHIRPRPLRSRLLLWVPPIAFSYMFIWPQLARWAVRTWPSVESVVGARPEFVLRIAKDGEGWASFVTSDYWRNLPSWPIAALTFAVCGFVIVYLLGSRSFCHYGCPYGVVFALADRVAPGKIKLKGTCVQCAQCTAACSSGIAVHKEIAKFGRVVSPSCLKDLDCVHSCPEEAIGFGFTRPGGVASLGKNRVRKRFDFTLREELLMALMVILTLPVYRGLYDRIPFLLTLALGAIHGYLAVMAVRLLKKQRLSLRGTTLKRDGQLTVAGGFFAGILIAVGALFCHSGAIRASEHLGESAFAQARSHWLRGAEAPDPLVDRARRHLERRQNWGMIDSMPLERMIAELERHRGEVESAEVRLGKILRVNPADWDTRLQLGRSFALRGAHDEARHALEPIVRKGSESGHARGEARRLLASMHLVETDSSAAEAELLLSIEESPDEVLSHAALAELWAKRGELVRAEAVLREAIVAAPQWPEAHRRLGLVLLARGVVPEALAALRGAIDRAPLDPGLEVDLGRALAGTGDLSGAERSFRRALEHDPEFLLAHFCLGHLLTDLGRADEARPYLHAVNASQPVP